MADDAPEPDETTSHPVDVAHVDRQARDRAVRLLRQWREGLIEAPTLRERWPEESDDVALWAIRDAVFSFLPTEAGEAPPSASAPARDPEEARQLFSRCELFLQGDRPYPWPLAGSFQRLRFLVWLGGLGVFAVLLTLVQIALLPPVLFVAALLLAAFSMKPLLRRLELRTFRAAGDFAAWPFLSKEEIPPTP